MKFPILLCILIIFQCCTSSPEDEWKDLFNNKDLSGWDTWLAVPDSSYNIPGLLRDSSGRYTQPLGLNNDPLNVFTVSETDGSQAIHISGQGWGAITSKDEYENFNLSLEFKWGENRFAPRDSAKRDSGILYFCVGDHGAASGAWMQSQECQVQEGDTGDYWSVGGAIADVRGKKTIIDGKEYWQYQPDGAFRTIGKEFDGKTWDMLRGLKKSTHEKVRGEWNTVEVFAYGGTVIHNVNGYTVMVIENSRRQVDGAEVPLTKGKIQLQSEGAEVYYRNIKIRSIKELPPLQ